MYTSKLLHNFKSGSKEHSSLQLCKTSSLVCLLDCFSFFWADWILINSHNKKCGFYSSWWWFCKNVSLQLTDWSGACNKKSQFNKPRISLRYLASLTLKTVTMLSRHATAVVNSASQPRFPVQLLLLVSTFSLRMFCDYGPSSSSWAWCFQKLILCCFVLVTISGLPSALFSETSHCWQFGFFVWGFKGTLKDHINISARFRSLSWTSSCVLQGYGLCCVRVMYAEWEKQENLSYSDTRAFTHYSGMVTGFVHLVV